MVTAAKNGPKVPSSTSSGETERGIRFSPRSDATNGSQHSQEIANALIVKKTADRVGESRGQSTSNVTASFRGACFPARPGLPPGGGGLHGDFVEPPRFNVIDEAAHLVLAWDEGAGLDSGDRLAHALFEVREGLEPERRADAGVLLDLGADLVVLERQHAAVGVMDEDDLLGAQQPLRDRPRPDRIGGGDAAGIAEDMGIPFLEPQDPADVQPGVHASEDEQLLGRWEWQTARAERSRVRLVVLQQIVGNTHNRSSFLVERPLLVIRFIQTRYGMSIGVFEGCHLDYSYNRRAVAAEFQVLVTGYVGDRVGSTVSFVRDGDLRGIS